MDDTKNSIVKQQIANSIESIGTVNAEQVKINFVQSTNPREGSAIVNVTIRD